MLLQRIHTKYTLIRYSFTASSTKSISCRTNISSISTSSLEHINQIFFDCIFYQIYRTNISSVSHSNQTFFDCTFHETKSRFWNRPRKKFSQRIFLQIYLEHLGNQIFFYCILHPKPKSTVESIFHTKPRTNNRIILDCVKSTSQRIDFKIGREREGRKNSRATNAFHRVVVSILRSFPVEINREGGGARNILPFEIFHETGTRHPSRIIIPVVESTARVDPAISPRWRPRVEEGK